MKRRILFNLSLNIILKCLNYNILSSVLNNESCGQKVPCTQMTAHKESCPI